MKLDRKQLEAFAYGFAFGGIIGSLISTGWPVFLMAFVFGTLLCLVERDKSDE